MNVAAPSSGVCQNQGLFDFLNNQKFQETSKLTRGRAPGLAIGHRSCRLE
jgi:hypothetical protein